MDGWTDRQTDRLTNGLCCFSRLWCSVRAAGAAGRRRLRERLRWLPEGGPSSCESNTTVTPQQHTRSSFTPSSESACVFVPQVAIKHIPMDTVEMTQMVSDLIQVITYSNQMSDSLVCLFPGLPVPWSACSLVCSPVCLVPGLQHSLTLRTPCVSDSQRAAG